MIYESDWEWYGEEHLSLAVDPCNNLHIGFYESQNSHLLYDHGVLDSNPQSCDPEGSPFYGRGSGNGAGSSGGDTRGCPDVKEFWGSGLLEPALEN